MSVSETIPFGLLLKQLRKRAGMTQRDLAAALDYSDSLISNLEQGQRLPDPEVVAMRYVPALGLQDEPVLAARLVEEAAAARGERPPDFRRSLGGDHDMGRERPKNDMGNGEAQHSRLPFSPTPLIGRDEEIHRLCNRLLGHTGRLLTLIGPPGIGKTQLALAVARFSQSTFRDGAVFVALAEIVDVDVMASTIHATLGWKDDSPGAPRTKLIESLRRKKLLLVLDNCEQIADAALVVAELLENCPEVVILATSRERLHLRSEQRYQVPPLNLDSAVELFRQRAAVVNESFVLTEVDRSTLEAICEKLDRLPLAIELCAAQIDFLAPAQLLEQLRRRPLDVLVDGAYDLPRQQRTLRHAIQRSYALLHEGERSLLRSLCVFSGGFALPEFEELDTWKDAIRAGNPAEKATPLAALHALVGKSLVRVESSASGKQRYFLLEMIREFAVEQMRAQGEEAELRERHYHIYLEFVRNTATHYQDEEISSSLTEMESEHDNLRACLQWAIDQSRFDDAAWFVLPLEDFWRARGYDYEGAKWITQLLPHRQSFSNNLRLAILTTYFFLSAYFLNEFQPDKRFVDEMLQLVESDTHLLLRVPALAILAEIRGVDRVAATGQAVAYARAAAQLPELGREFCGYEVESMLPKALWSHAHSLTERGDVMRALPVITESYKLLLALGRQTWIHSFFGLLGQLALLKGEVQEAAALLHKAISLGGSLNYPLLVCEWQPLLGLVKLYLGDAAEARRTLEESLGHCLQLKNRIYLKWVCMYLAELALWEGNVDEAGDWLMQSMAYHGEFLRVTIYEVKRLFLFACLATARQEYARAALLFGLSEAAHGQIHSIFYAGPMRPQIERSLATTREALGVERFDEEFAAGERLPLGEAYTTLLKPSLRVPALSQEMTL